MFLENPPDNPCWGCGPSHPSGLRLNFERIVGADGVDEVVTRPVPKADEIGWPGLFHTGLHFAVLYEVSYWAAWELSGAVHNSHGPQVFDQHRLPRTGKSFVARARIASRDADGLRLRASSHNADGKPLATLETSWRPASRERAAKAGLELPEYLTREMLP